MLIGAMLALGAARTATESAAMVASGPRAQAKAQRESNLRDRTGGATAQDRERASEAAENAAKTSGAAAGGAFLALVAALFGAIVAASRSSGRSLADEFRFGVRHGNGGAMRSGESVPTSRTDEEMRPRM